MSLASGESISVEELYCELGSVLCGIMQSRFGIPPDDAEALLHDIFASLIRSGTTVQDAKKWLIGAACNASRYYWRQKRINVSIPDEIAVEPSADTGVAIGQVLDRLPERAREVLRLKYLEGLSGNEIARRYGTTVEYAHVLIHRSLEKARAVAREKGQ